MLPAKYADFVVNIPEVFVEVLLLTARIMMVMLHLKLFPLHRELSPRKFGKGKAGTSGEGQLPFCTGSFLPK